MIDNKKLLENFFELVRIDSESKNEGAIAARLEQELRDLGCEVSTDDAGAAIGSNGHNVYGFLKGTLPGEPLLYSAHMDTVVPGIGIDPYVDGEGTIRSRGDTILASDDKSGIAGILAALRTIRDQKLPCHDTEVVFTIHEEGGLKGAKGLDYSRIRSKMAVVLDSSGDPGKIITQGPGQIKIDAEVIGRAAHAGIAPEQGISAIQVAAEGVTAMKLLRIDAETTANIGTFTAVGATNIVPERVKIVAETRSQSLEKLEAQAKHMVDCLQAACDKNGAKLECKAETSYVGYHVPDEAPVVQRVMEASKVVGLEPFTASTGGGSDANVMQRQGICAIVLATGMAKVHTTDEFITQTNLEKTAELVLTLMTK